MKNMEKIEVSLKLITKITISNLKTSLKGNFKAFGTYLEIRQGNELSIMLFNNTGSNFTKETSIRIRNPKSRRRNFRTRKLRQCECLKRIKDNFELERITKWNLCCCTCLNIFKFFLFKK